MDIAETVWFDLHMSKFVKEVKVTIQHGDTTVSYTAPIAQIVQEATENLAPRLSITLYSPESKGMTTKLKKDEPCSTERDRKLYEAYAASVQEALKLAETSQMQAEVQLEKLGLEIAEREHAAKLAIKLAVHGAIQAGLDTEELTAGMRDDHAGYVSDMADSIYLATDLDRLINGSED